MSPGLFKLRPNFFHGLLNDMDFSLNQKSLVSQMNLEHLTALVCYSDVALGFFIEPESSVMNFESDCAFMITNFSNSVLSHHAASSIAFVF